MRGSGLLLAVLAFAGLFLQGAPAHADKRVALVIGNSKYKSTAPLANPANDAEDTAAALRELGFEVISKLDVDKREFDTLLARFARASRNADAALFFYAGHGMQYQGRNYIMPVDAELEDEISLRYQMTAIDDVKSALEQTAGIKIMVLDACRNNPLAERFIRSISTGTRDVGAVRGFTRPEQTRGMVVAYATQADDTAQDGHGRNSPFTQAFLTQLKEPGLEIASMFRRIAAEVYDTTKGRQVPELSISLLTDYSLNQSETDRTIWARIRATADAVTLREFLTRFPNSFYAPDARTRLDFVERALPAKQVGEDAAQKEAGARAREAADQEKRASDMQARERELTARLAAAEAEQKRMAAELAVRRDERASTDARTQADRDAENVRREREKAGVEAAARDKARVDQETRDRTRADQEAREKARLDQAQRDRQTKEDAERTRQLQAEIARLADEVSRARANALTEQKKAEDASAASKAASLKVASASPGPLPKPVLTDDQSALVQPIQSEMRRLGCFSTSGDWFSSGTRQGLALVGRYAKLATVPDLPSPALLDDLKGRKGRLCPLVCGTREEERGGRCMRKTCGRGEFLDEDGDCVAKPVARTKRPAPAVAERPRVKPQAEPERVARPKAAPRPVAAASRAAPSGGGGRCFSFSGRQYCE